MLKTENMGPEEEFEEYDSKGAWLTVFQKIRQEALVKHDYSLKDAKRPEFRGRNRYRDVSPYDHSRVRLERNNLDYINASFVRADAANRSYILTQGPLMNTAGHLWLMVWEQHSAAVLMLNKLVEMGRGPLPDTAPHFWLMVWEQNCRAVLMLNRVIEKGQVKCHQYFPIGNANEGEEEVVFDEVNLKVRLIDEVDKSYYTMRTLLLSDLQSGDTKEVLQFHYTTWPDFGVPESPQAFLDFLFDVRQSGALDVNVGPPVIHCSAGIGRSGTFCLVDTCLVLIERQGSARDIDVCSVLMDMRKYRMGLIQTADQLRFSYLAIIQGVKQVLPPGSSGSRDSGFTERKSIMTSQSLSQDHDSDIDDIVTLNNNAIELNTESDDDSIPDSPPPLPPRLDRSLGQPAGGAESNPPGGDSKQADGGEVIVKPGRDEEDAGREAVRREGVEIRRRNREERLRSTTEKIAAMKKRQEESERWRARKHSLKPYLVRLGIGMAVLLGGFILYRYHFS